MLTLFRELANLPFPQSPADQLVRATDAVFRSWNSPKAAEYRSLNHIDDAIGTAVTRLRATPDQPAAPYLPNRPA
jgi:pyruvate,orthophosphate dikinase